MEQFNSEYEHKKQREHAGDDEKDTSCADLADLEVAATGLAQSLPKGQRHNDGDSVMATGKVETYEDTPMSELMLRDESDGYVVLSGRGHIVTIKIGEGTENRKALENLRIPGWENPRNTM